MDFLKGKIIEELAQQGHRASGALEKSIEALVEEKRKNGSIRVYTVNNEPSMTDQQVKDDCDVNFIVNKFTN